MACLSPDVAQRTRPCHQLLAVFSSKVNLGMLTKYHLGPDNWAHTDRLGCLCRPVKDVSVYLSGCVDNPVYCKTGSDGCCVMDKWENAPQ